MRMPIVATAVLVALGLGCSPTGTVPGEAVAVAQSKPESVIDRASYGIGYNLGKGLSEQKIEAQLELVLAGVRDGFGDATPLLTVEEMQTALSELQQQVQARQAQLQQEQGEMNKQQGEAFLATNAERSEVQSTTSGLQYEILTAGDGAKPSATDTVTVHYRGTLIDGTVFDSSYDRGEPATFPLSRVIAGWTEGLQLMPVGSKWKLFLPSHLAYGEQGAGGDIGPNAALIFEVELLSIQ
jgi:FKBP-type peptidyl-prolyl cis-trans isomerase FklB